MIDKGRKEIFFLFLLHYNDTCKVNPSFTVGECKVVKLNILNMKNFLDTVNSCSGKVNMLCPDAVSYTHLIEETHPVGRLFDLDVIDINGQKLSRPSFRKCIICGCQAQECARTRKHSVNEMQSKIEEMLMEFDCQKV